MKRYGGIFDTAFSEASLYIAYMDARRAKRSKRACLQFERRLAANLGDLRHRLQGGSYRPRTPYEFWISDPKPRLIRAPSFPDLVVQHAIYRHVYDIFDRSFIFSSYACRKGKGTLAAADYAQSALRKREADYTLHLDVRRFFYSISVDVLRGLIERKIKDRRLVEVVSMFAGEPGDVGIPIGNLLSQLFANVYMNPIDHYVTRELKPVAYARYMDDMLVVARRRRDAVEMRDAIERRLTSQLRLGLSKAEIKPVGKGIDFVGYRAWRSVRVVRPRAVREFVKSVKRGDLAAIVSRLGHARHTSSMRYMLDILRREDCGIYHQLPAYYHRVCHAPAGGVG